MRRLQCPVCGLRHPLLSSKDYDTLLTNVMQDIIEDCIYQHMQRVVVKVRNANRGNLSPDEEKILQIVMNVPKELEDAES